MFLTALFYDIKIRGFKVHVKCKFEVRNAVSRDTPSLSALSPFGFLHAKP